MSAPLAKRGETGSLLRVGDSTFRAPNGTPLAAAKEGGIVDAEIVTGWLWTIGGAGPHRGQYGELGTAIAEAANQDPVSPEDPEGCVKTALALVILAWERSQFHTTLSTPTGLGVFQILPPKDYPIDASLLLLPRTACHVAIDLIRRRFLAMPDVCYGEAFRKPKLLR